jgi:hypothetical protein
MSHNINIMIQILIKYFIICIFKYILAYTLLLSYVYGNMFILHTNFLSGMCNRSLFERHFCNRPLSFSIYLYAGFGRTLDSSQVCVTAITGATGNCTFEASPLLEITTQLPLSKTVYLISSTI